MYQDYFVFDNVVHMYDNRPDNVIDPVAMNFQDKFHEINSIPGFEAESHEGRATSIAEAKEHLFEVGGEDMAIAQTVPLFSYWRDGFAPAKLQYELSQAAPDRVVFCGGVDPVFQGLNGAAAEMERQITEWNAKSFKFYQGHHAGLTWRADDRRLAYPLYERMLEHGINIAQFHKGIPLGHEYVEDLRPNDVQQAAVDFPEMTFVLHHFGVPYVDETVNISARFENVWLSLSAIVNWIPVAPALVNDIIGKALRNIGADRLLWGSEAFAYPRVGAYIRAFVNMEIPVALQEGYGYPALTESKKRRILGLNQARLLGIDVEAKLRELHPGIEQATIDRALDRSSDVDRAH